VNIQLYIRSGIIESYVLGLAEPAEQHEFEQLLPLYPELQDALKAFQQQVEELAARHAVPPPPDTHKKD
jgi:anti-sigma factor RsiW